MLDIFQWQSVPCYVWRNMFLFVYFDFSTLKFHYFPHHPHWGRASLLLNFMTPKAYSKACHDSGFLLKWCDLFLT